MKKSFFILVLMSLIVLPTLAEVTVTEATEPDYLINAGFSEALAEDIFMLKNRANSKPIEPLYDKNQNAFTKGWLKFWAYIDPAREEVDKIHHDIKLTPSFSDL